MPPVVIVRVPVAKPEPVCALAQPEPLGETDTDVEREGEMVAEMHVDTVRDTLVVGVVVTHGDRVPERVGESVLEEHGDTVTEREGETVAVMHGDDDNDTVCEREPLGLLTPLGLAILAVARCVPSME